MLKRFRNQFSMISLMLVVFLLSGCLGGGAPKAFDVIVQVTPALEGVKIHSGSADGEVLGTTNAAGTVEFKVTGEATIVPVKDGYTFEPASQKVTKAATIEFKATAVEAPALTITGVAKLNDVNVLIDTTPFEKLELPEKIKATLSDSTTVELGVEWQAGEYNHEVAGSYTLKGQLALIDGITNPGNLHAEIKVNVRYVPADQEELFEEAGDKLDAAMEELGLDAVEGDIELVDEITAVDGSVFSVTWESSNPEVLGTDGKVNRTAKDETVTLTATLKLSETGLSALNAADPRVKEYSVTVLADPQLKAIAEAEAAVAAVEAIEGPNHYDEVAGIEDLFKAADEAVALVEDALTRFGFEKRVDVERKAFLTILQKHVDAVNSANTDLDLLEALVAFWTVESDLIGVYKDLVDDKDNDTSDVHKIQKNVIEKAPLTLEETTIVEAIVKSAKSESLIKFKETLSGYAFYFERINFDSNAVLEEYRMDIADSKDLSSLEEIQEIIDEVNYDYAKDAVDEATKSIDRKDWNEAVALLVYVADGEDKEALQKDLDAHDLIPRFRKLRQL